MYNAACLKKVTLRIYRLENKYGIFFSNTFTNTQTEKAKIGYIVSGVNYYFCICKILAEYSI